MKSNKKSNHDMALATRARIGAAAKKNRGEQDSTAAIVRREAFATRARIGTTTALNRTAAACTKSPKKRWSKWRLNFS